MKSILCRKSYWTILALGLTIVITGQVLIGYSQQPPIHIIDEDSNIYPNPVSVNQSSQLKICVRNLNESEVLCVLKCSLVEDLSIFPSGQQNVTVLGKGHGYVSPSYSRTYFYFTLISNKTGSYPITVGLWCNSTQVDFYSTTLQVREEKPFDVFSYESRLSLVYWIAILAIGIVYLKVLYAEGSTNGKEFWKIAVSYTACLLIIVEINIFWGLFSEALSIIISPSIGRIELVLAIAFILSFASLILMRGRLDVSFKLANIIVFLIILPIVLDWLLIPKIPPTHTLGAEIIWQLIEIVVSTFIGYILSIIFKPKPKEIL